MDGKAQLYKDILDIAMYAINRAKPDYAVKRALGCLRFDGDIYLVAVGKAAWQMADAAMKCVPKPICFRCPPQTGQRAGSGSERPQ